MNTQNQDTLRKIKTAYETNNVAVIEKINAIFGEPNPLTDKLLEKYDQLGNTPIAETKLYKTLSTGKGVFAFAKELAKKFKIKSSDFTTMEYASFINMCKNKVTSFTNEDGSYKSTPLTENAKMPTFEQLELVGTASVDLRALAIEVANGASDEVEEEFEKAQTHLSDVVSEVTGVSFKNLSEWEKNLLTEDVIAYSGNILNTMLGKH